MRFAEPAWLFALLAIPGWIVAVVLAARARRRATERFAGGARHAPAFRADVAANRRAVKAILLGVAFASTLVALARPQWGDRVEEVERTGIDLVVVIDTSRSMAVEDVGPNRFRQARLSAAELVRRLGGDRIGLVAFAGEAALLCPLTVDHEAIGLFLDALDLDGAPAPGTALADALDVARRAFGEEVETGDRARTRMVVVYSDGEDHERGLDRAIEALNRSGVTAFTVGVGTIEGGPIPVHEGDDGTYKKDREGRVVTSRLDEAVLERIALDTGGRYHRATAAGMELDPLVETVEGSDAGTLSSTVRVRYEERFAIPVWIALLAIAAELALPDGRGRRVRREEPS